MEVMCRIYLNYTEVKDKTQTVLGNCNNSYGKQVFPLNLSPFSIRIKLYEAFCSLLKDCILNET